MRFRAPDRHELPVSARCHPALAGLADDVPGLFAGDWPTVAALNEGVALHHRYAARPLRFAAQDAVLLADGKHYEQRIVEDGVIATRPGNWHDLFNAVIWRRFTGIKSAVNWRFTRDFPAGSGTRERSRTQMALTHFDEAGVIVRIGSVRLREAWDRHDWPSLFADPIHPWHEHVEMLVFGHALLEHCLAPHLLLVGKAVLVDATALDGAMRDAFADAVAAGEVIRDPLDLRPLPLSGIPGWFAAQDPAFYREGPCFRPLREGRRYPPAWRAGSGPPAAR